MLQLTRSPIQFNEETTPVNNPQGQYRQQPSNKVGGIAGIALDLLPFGRIGEKVVKGQNVSGAELLTEGLLTAVPFGLGRIGKGAKAAGAIDDVAKAAKYSAGRNITERTGRNMLRNSLGLDVLKTASKTKPFTIFDADDLLDEAMKIGLKGTPKTIQRQIGVQYQKLGDEIAKKLQRAKKTTTVSKVFDEAFESVRKRLPISHGDVRPQDELLNTLLQLEELSDGGKLTATALKQFKDGLNVEQAFRKVTGELGSDLTAKELVDLEMWKKADDWLASLAQGVKDLTKRQSKLYALAQTTARRIPTSTVTGPGELLTRALEPGARSIQSRAGSKLAKAGASQAENPIRANLTGQALLRSPRLITPDGQEPQMVDPMAGPVDMLTDSLGPTLPDQTAAPVQGTAASGGLTAADIQQAILQDLQETGGENIEQIQMVAEMYGIGAQPEGQSLNVTKPTSEKFSQAYGGMQALQQLEALIQQGGVPSGTRTPGRGIETFGIGADIRELSGTGQFDALAFNAVDNLLRILTGAQAPESEIRRYMNQYIPKAGDSPETVQTKLDLMRQQFNSILSLAQMPGTGEQPMPLEGQ